MHTDLKVSQATKYKLIRTNKLYSFQRLVSSLFLSTDALFIIFSYSHAPIGFQNQKHNYTRSTVI